MKIIICGPAIDEQMEKKLYSASPAAGRFLNNMIHALNLNGYSTRRAIYISYPVVDDSAYQAAGVSEDMVVFKDRWILPSILRFRRRLAASVEGGDIVVFYNMTYAYWGLSQKVKKMGAVPVLMLADFTDWHEEAGLPRKVISFLCEREFRRFDSVISLADFGPERFSKKARVQVLRGGINFGYFSNISQPTDIPEQLTIMYAGLLSEVTGVDILLRAMRKVKAANLRLLISGKGDLEEAVKSEAKNDPRIQFLGFLDVDSYYRKLNEANIFVNPRNMDLPQNRNNFPSKVLEYLATGRVIISTRFSGFSEFDGLMEWVDGDEDSLAGKIDETVARYEKIYRQTYESNRAAAQRYDWTVQARKIIEAAGMDGNPPAGQ